MSLSSIAYTTEVQGQPNCTQKNAEDEHRCIHIQTAREVADQEQKNATDSEIDHPPYDID